MDLLDTLIYKQKTYPMLYDGAKAESACLNHLYFVIGNGYEWYKGQLVESDSCPSYIRNKPSPAYDSDKVLVQNNLVSTEFNNYIDSIILSWKQYNTRNGIETVNYWYPISGYSNIASMPRNIKPDWKYGGVLICWLLLIADYDTNPSIYRDEQEHAWNTTFCRSFLMKYEKLAKECVAHRLGH